MFFASPTRCPSLYYRTVVDLADIFPRDSTKKKVFHGSKAMQSSGVVCNKRARCTPNRERFAQLIYELITNLKI